MFMFYNFNLFILIRQSKYIRKIELLLDIYNLVYILYIELKN